MSPLLALRVISLRRKDFVAIGGIADIENCRWKVSHRWHDCALKKTSSPQSGWGSWQPRTNGTSIDCAIAPTDTPSPSILRAVALALIVHRERSRLRCNALPVPPLHLPQ